MSSLLEDLSDYDSNDYFEYGYCCEAIVSSNGGPPPNGPIYTFRGHTGEVYSLACSPIDSTLVATGGGDAKSFLWKIFHGDSASQLHGYHTDSVSSLAFSYDGRFLASGSMDGIVQVWDVYGNLIRKFDVSKAGIEWLRWHPSGYTLLAGTEDANVWKWTAGSKGSFNIFSGHGGRVTCGDFTPDGRIICTGSDDATLRIWNSENGENIHVVQGDPYKPYHTKELTCLSISSSSTLALTGSKDGSVHTVNISTGRVIDTLAPHTDSVECVGFAPSDPWAAVGGLDKKLVIWDIEHSLPRVTCDHEEGVTCLAWLGPSYVATGCLDRNVRVWDSRSAECVRNFIGHSDAIFSVEVSANREYLVSTSLDSTACVFDVKWLQ